MDLSMSMFATAADYWKAEAERLRRERDELRRWKSTNAPRLDALEGLLRAAQSGAAAGREAIASLSSERAANAILTSEGELLAARLAEIEAQEPAMYVLRSTKDRPAPWAVRHPRYLDVGTGDLVRLGLDHLDPLYASPAPPDKPVQAADLDADIIDAQRAVVQQLASRTTCDWPGKCRHQRPAPAAAPEHEEGGAPHVDDAYYMGATGGEATDGERLAFEQGGNIDPRAMRTRQLWAAWRDRAALASLKAPNGARQPAGTHAQDQRRPCRCGPDGRSDSTSCPKGGER